MRVIACLALGLVCGSAIGEVEIPAVAYHDIVPARNGDPFAVTVAEFDQQLAYLKRKGYQPISLAILDAARRGVRPLPPKPILLTFDDGLRSFAVHALPRLERHGFPASVSIVTGWADTGRMGDDSGVAVLTWDELRRLSRSPLIEFVSHGDELHRGIAADAQGTLVAAATARAFGRDRIEDETARERRVSADLARSAARIEAELGAAPRAVAWPYGEYDAALVSAAASLGMTYHFTLDDAPTTLARLPQINRFTFRNYRGLDDFARALVLPAHRRRDERFVELDLAMFSGAGVAEGEAMLSRVLERLRLLRVNTVVLHPFNADRTRSFFATGAMPIEGDLTLRITMAILRRTGVQRIYLRLRGEDADVLARDYVRRHPLHGVIVDDDLDPAALERVRGHMARYRPAARLFVPPGVARPGSDGTWIRVDAGEPAAAIRALAGRFDPASTLYLIRDGTGDASALRSAMTALREGGARHFGYVPDAMLTNVPDARIVAAPLHAHTIAERRR